MSRGQAVVAAGSATVIAVSVVVCGAAGTPIGCGFAVGSIAGSGLEGAGTPEGAAAVIIVTATHRGSDSARTGKASALTMASVQIKWRVAADTRRRTSDRARVAAATSSETFSTIENATERMGSARTAFIARLPVRARVSAGG